MYRFSPLADGLMSTLASRGHAWEYWSLHEWCEVRIARTWSLGALTSDSVAETRKVALAVRMKGEEGLRVVRLAKSEIAETLLKLKETAPDVALTNENWFADSSRGAASKVDFAWRDALDFRPAELWKDAPADSRLTRQGLSLDLLLSARKDSEGSVKVAAWSSRTASKIG